MLQRVESGTKADLFDIGEDFGDVVFGFVTSIRTKKLRISWRKNEY